MDLEKFVAEVVTLVMQKILENSTVTVPIPNHQELRTGTLRSIIRQSEISRIEFETVNG